MINKLKEYVDFKLIGILSAAYLLFVIVYFSKNAYLKILGLAYIKMDWSYLIYINVQDWFIITIFIVFLVFTTKFMIDRKTKLIYIILIHLFFSFFIGAFTISISWLIRILNYPNWSLKQSFSRAFESFIQLVDLHFLIYMSLVTIIYMYYYFKKNKENELEAMKLQDQLTKSHLQFLQSQMNPHFLFNTLNGIHSLMDINISKSKNMVVDLSELLRNILDKKDQNLIELQEELDVLKKYIDIKKTRFSDQLNIILEIDKGLENVLVPNMLIQPLIENSTKHGYGENHSTLDVLVKITSENEKLIIKVENTGVPLNAELSTLLKRGIGLNNLKERLQTLYGDNHELKIYNNSDLTVVTTEISFPIQLLISELTDEPN